jgi:hypothetical protein
MESKIKLSQEEAEQLFGEIDNQGFGYWIENYGYNGEEDPELVQLCKEADEAMSKLRKHIEAIWEHYDIG